MKYEKKYKRLSWFDYMSRRNILLTIKGEVEIFQEHKSGPFAHSDDELVYRWHV